MLESVLHGNIFTALLTDCYLNGVPLLVNGTANENFEYMHNNNNFKHHGEKTKHFLGRHNLIFPHTMNIYSSRAPLFRCFFKLGSTTLKAEQPLKRMVLQKKNKKKKMDSI